MLNGIEPMTLLRIVTEAAPWKMIRNCVLTIFDNVEERQGQK